MMFFGIAVLAVATHGAAWRMAQCTSKRAQIGSNVMAFVGVLLYVVLVALLLMTPVEI